MLGRLYSLKLFSYIEFAGVSLSIFLLPIDRFPYLHYIPLKLGAISFILLLIAAAWRSLQVVTAKHWTDFKKIALATVLLLLPVAAYAQSIHYALDRLLATGATKLLLVAALKGLCFFILLNQNPRLWQLAKKSFYVITALIVAFGFFQFIADVLGASPRITDLKSCCTSNSTYVFPRVHSVSIEPLYFANFLLIPLWIMAVDFYKNKLVRRNKYLLTLFIATGALLILSTARSALVAAAISAVVFWLGTSKGLRKISPRLVRSGLLVLAVAISFVLISAVAAKHIHKSAINGSNSGVSGNLGIFGSHTLNPFDASAHTRYSTWPKAFSYIKQQPLRGVGAYNSRVRLNYDAYKNGASDLSLQPFNNDLLGLLVDLGLIGVICFGPVIIALAIAIWRQFKLGWSSPAAPYVLAALAMAVQSNFFHSILLARVWVVVGIALSGLYKLPGMAKEAAK